MPALIFRSSALAYEGKPRPEDLRQISGKYVATCGKCPRSRMLFFATYCLLEGGKRGLFNSVILA
jgi:hypothetical protein